MRTLAIATLTLAFACSLIGAPTAQAQTLAERIAAVKNKRAAHNTPTAGELSERGKILQALLYEKITVNFLDTPAREAIGYLKTRLGINIIGRFSDDATGVGIDPDTPITIEVEDLYALDVLELVLEQCGGAESCSWQLRRGFLEVGTKDRLSTDGAKQVKVYNIDELLFEAPYHDNSPPSGIVAPYTGYPYGYGGVYPHTGRYGGGYGGGGFGSGFGGPYIGGGSGYGGSLSPGGTRRTITLQEGRAMRAQEVVELIINAIEPNAWERNGGDWASIKYHDGALVVRAPDFIHRAINGYPSVPPPSDADAGKGGDSNAGG